MTAALLQGVAVGGLVALALSAVILLFVLVLFVMRAIADRGDR